MSKDIATIASRPHTKQRKLHHTDMYHPHETDACIILAGIDDRGPSYWLLGFENIRAGKILLWFSPPFLHVIPSEPVKTCLLLALQPVFRSHSSAR